MKRKLFSTAIALILCAVAFAQGVNFRDIPFDQALEQSVAENKPIFLDCYTEWCGPCKMMEKEVFPFMEAGDYFNARFINCKMDMEKGEGPEISKKYNVTGYPTYLLLHSDGTELYRISGYWPLWNFIHRIDAGLHIKTPLPELEAAYNSGNISKEDLTNYWLLADARKIDEIGKKLSSMLTESDKLESLYWPITTRAMNAPLSEGLNFVLANRLALENNVGKREVDLAIYDVFQRALLPMTQSLSPEDREKLPDILAKLKSIDFVNKEGMEALAGLVGAKIDGDPDRYIDILASNYQNLQPVTLLLTFQRVEALINDRDAKRYYARLSDLATEIDKNVPTRLGMDARAASYKRMSTEQ